MSEPREIEAPANGDRYIIVETSGHAIDPAASRSGRWPSSSYSVLDTADCWKEVYRAYSYNRGSHHITRRQRVKRECERLNELDRLGPA